MFGGFAIHRRMSIWICNSLNNDKENNCNCRIWRCWYSMAADSEIHRTPRRTPNGTKMLILRCGGCSVDLQSNEEWVYDCLAVELGECGGLQIRRTPRRTSNGAGLIVRAVYDNYLRYTTSYEDVREAFVAASAAMNVSGLVSAVLNA